MPMPCQPTAPSRTRPVAAVALGVLGVLTLVMTGCSNPWRTSYEPAVGASGAAYPPTERLVIRQVPWDRLVPTLDQIQDRLVNSDVHPSEWTPEQRAEVQAMLLRALQLPHEPGQAEVFGVSSFATTTPVRIEDGTLEQYARSVGADYVIWADRSLGLRDTVVREPVQRSGFYGGWGYGKRGRGYSGLRSETVWVPVVVRRENIAFLAFYVRTTPVPE